MRTLWIVALLALEFLSASPGTATEPSGSELVAARCTGCHRSEVYTRPDRKVGSLEALRAQVDHCSSAAETGWSAEEKAAVVRYLNEAYYRFP